jgi:hypothetical protein
MEIAVKLISELFELLIFGILASLSKRLILSDRRLSSGNRFYGNIAVFGSSPTRDSKIVSDFPDIFFRFRTHLFDLLYRGSRDGFGCICLTPLECLRETVPGLAALTTHRRAFRLH